MRKKYISSFLCELRKLIFAVGQRSIHRISGNAENAGSDIARPDSDGPDKSDCWLVVLLSNQVAMLSQKGRAMFRVYQ